MRKPKMTMVRVEERQLRALEKCFRPYRPKRQDCVWVAIYNYLKMNKPGGRADSGDEARAAGHGGER